MGETKVFQDNSPSHASKVKAQMAIGVFDLSRSKRGAERVSEYDTFCPVGRFKLAETLN